MAELKYLTIEHLSLKYIKRIFSQIQINILTDCWEWTGSLTCGYGRIRIGGPLILVHRLMFAWLVQPIPKGRGRHIPQIDHIVCSNRRCVNPAHLALVTPRQNTLRGKTVSGINSVKTYCDHGHLLPVGPNTKTGKRRCVPCDRQRTHEWRIAHPDFHRTDEYRRKHRKYRREKGITKASFKD